MTRRLGIALDLGECGLIVQLTRHQDSAYNERKDWAEGAISAHCVFSFLIARRRCLRRSQ